MRSVGLCRRSTTADGRVDSAVVTTRYCDTVRQIFALAFPNVDVLPAKETGIDRPGTWSEHGQCCTECSQQDVDPRISMRQEDFPRFKAGHERPRDRCP